MFDVDLDHNEEFEKIADREDVSYAIGWLLDQVKYAQQQLAKKNEIIKKYEKAVNNIIETKDHKSEDSIWILYNTSWIKGLAREALREVKCRE